MLTLYTLYVALLFVTTISGIALAAYAWHRRDTPGAAAFAGLMLTTALASFSLAMLAFTSSPEAADFWGRRVRFVANATAPALLLTFAIQYTGRERWLNWLTLALLFTVPLVSLILTWAGDAHYLFLHLTTAKAGPFTFLGRTARTGPWNVVHLAYSYLTAIFSLGLLLLQVFRTRYPYRGQALLLFLGGLVPLLANVPDSFMMGAARPSFTPFGFVVMGVVWAWALFRYRLFDIVPVARGLILDSMEDAVLVTDVQGRVVDLNPAAERLLGGPASATIGRQVKELLPAWCQVQEQNRGHGSRTEIVTGVGETARSLSLSCQPIHAHNGEVVGELAILRDITERKATEVALRESQANLSALISSTEDIIVSRDREGRAIAFNPGFVRIVRELFDVEARPGIRTSDHLPDAERAHWEQILQKVLSGTSHREEFTCMLGGEIRHYDLSLNPIWADGQVIGSAEFTREISDRKRMEQALQESETKYRRLVENLQEGVWAIDTEARTTYVNQRMADMLGYSEEEMLGKHLFDFMDEQGIEIAQRNLERRQAGIQERHDFEFLRRDGTRIYTTLETSAITDEEGSYRGALAGVMDITDRRRAEEALRRRVEELDVLNRIAQMAATLTDLPQALEAVAEIVTSQLSVAASVIATWRNDRVEVVAWSERDGVRPDMVGRSLPMASAATIREPLDRGEAVSFSDVLSMPWPGELDHLFRTRNIYAILIAPLRVRGTAFGVLAVATDEAGRTFSRDEISLAETVAADVAAAVDNARLYEQAQELAVAEERNRLARDLHDSVTQTLYSVALTAEALPRVWERHPDEAQIALKSLHRLSRGALAEMRALLLELRPTMLRETRLSELFRQLAHATMGRTRLHVEAKVEGERTLTEEVRLALYRIAQEALNNVVKHAEATQVTIHLRLQPAQVLLSVCDDGRGFVPEAVRGHGFGLQNMADRAKSIGAEFSLQCRPGEGTRIEVMWPEAPAERPADHLQRRD
jgi:PAS domain S-box-containing protein